MRRRPAQELQELLGYWIDRYAIEVEMSESKG